MRILPRLREAIIRRGDLLKPVPPVPTGRSRPHKRKASLYKSVPSAPSFRATDYTRSILLANGDVPNPITESHSYVRHKTLPSSVFPSRETSRSSESSGDVPRAMNYEERAWFADPYLRMLASPLRKCIVTDRYLPSDFLVRLAPMRVSPLSASRLRPDLSRVLRSLIPDGVEHSQYKARKSGRGVYILCSRDAVSLMGMRSSIKRVMTNVEVHSLICEHIGNLLRVRILQEFALLVDALKSRVPSTTHIKEDQAAGLAQDTIHSRVLRRLTRQEWDTIKMTGVIAYPDAVAVLVVPPVNRIPSTKKRPDPSMSSLAVTADTASDLEPSPEALKVTSESNKSPLKPTDKNASPRALPPLSTLHNATEDAGDLSQGDLLPPLQIPLYNGITLFPHRPHRMALHSSLTRLLSLEGRVLRKHRQNTSTRSVEGLDLKDSKASHAFLLCSNADTAIRGDSAAVAISLWRLRMYEGLGWESENTRCWVSNASRRRPSGLLGISPL